MATDGSLKLRRRERERETMGAGVAWQQEVAEHRDNHPEGEQREGGGRGSIHGTGAHNVSSRVAGNLSSTRAELAAIAQAVKMAPMEKELVILIDSAAAIRRLTWYRRKDFRPHPRKTKDFDIVREIIASLDERGRNGARTTMVKVHGHTGEPLHAVADAMATEGANRKMEDEERPLYEIPESKNLIFMFKEGDNGREVRGQWSPKVKTHIREHEADRLWEKRRAGTWAERFHSREGAGRRELGEALQRCGDWAVTG